MSRKRVHEEDWDRQRAHGRRKFRGDIQQVSTKTEEKESNDSILDEVPSTSAVYEESEDLLGRPYSPLPPLIIEKEPNKHDEPEEHYIELEKRIMKVYREMFCKDLPDATKGSDTDISDRSIPSTKYCETGMKVDTENSSSTETFPKSTTDCDLHSDTPFDGQRHSTDSLEYAFRGAELYKNNKGKQNSDDKVISSLSESDGIAPAECIQETDSSVSVKSNAGHRQITFKALVHRSYSDEIIQPGPSKINKQNVATTGSDEIQEMLEEHDASNISTRSSTRKKTNSREIKAMAAARRHTDAVSSLQNKAVESPGQKSCNSGSKSMDNDTLSTTLTHYETDSSKSRTRKRKTYAFESLSTKKPRK